MRYFQNRPSSAARPACIIRHRRALGVPSTGKNVPGVIGLNDSFGITGRNALGRAIGVADRASGGP
jgi:hypothetical protein